MKCTDEKPSEVNPGSDRGSAALQPLDLLLHHISPPPFPTRTGLHLFTFSFFPPAAGSFFLPWAAAAVLWACSLGAFCAAGAAELEDFEGCVGFEVELEGCRRRLPSSPAEDE